MAFPAPSAPVSNVSSTTNSGTFTPTTAHDDGALEDLILYIVSSHSNATLDLDSTSKTAGWRKLFYTGIQSTTVQQAVFWKRATSTSGAAEKPSFTSATSTQYSSQAYRLPPDTAFDVSFSNGSSTNSNPANENHLKVRDALYIVTRSGTGTTIPSAAPSGYSGKTDRAGGGSSGVSTSSAYKVATSSSEDPGNWTVSSTAWVCATIVCWYETSAKLTNWKAAVQNLTANKIALFVDDSLTSGAWGTGNRMASNARAASYPKAVADSFTACKASTANFCGDQGAYSADDNIEAYDSRINLTGGWTWSTSTYSLGGSMLYSDTNGSLEFTPGAAFDRIRIGHETFPGGDGNYVKVDAGANSPLISGDAANGLHHTDLSLGAGTSASKVIVTSEGNGNSSEIRYIDTWLDGVPQVSFINGGHYGIQVSDLINQSTYISPGNALLEMAPDLLVGLLGSNDDGPDATFKGRLVTLGLMGLVSGEVHFTPCPYVDATKYSFPEADQNARNLDIREVADQLNLSFFDLQAEPNWTSYAAQEAAGYMYTGDKAHLSGAGYAALADLTRAVIDPGPAAQALEPALLSNSTTFYAPSVVQVAFIEPTLLANTNSFFDPTVTPGAITLSPDLLGSTTAFYGATVTPGAVTLAPELLAASNTFYSPTVAVPPTFLHPPQLPSGVVVYAPTVAAGAITLTPPFAASTNVFHAPAVMRGQVALAPPFLASVNAFYDPILSQGTSLKELRPARLTNTNSFYGPTITTGAVSITPDLFTNANTFLRPTVFNALEPQSLAPALLQNATVFFHASASNDNAPLMPGTYPLSLEDGGSVISVALAGGGTVVVSAIASGVTVIPSALKGRS